MPHPEFDDPPTIGRDRQEPANPEAHDEADSISDQLAAPPVDDLQAQHDAEIVAVAPLGEDETRADLREQFLSIAGNTEEAFERQYPELLDAYRRRQADEPHG